MLKKILITSSDAAYNYFLAVKKAGGEPLVATAAYAEMIDAAKFDGLILSGGCDVNPARYGEEVNGAQTIDNARDAFEFDMLEKFTELKKPVLGICRGCQLINVFFGGSLIQHLDTADAHVSHDGKVSYHMTTADEGSVVAGLYGTRFETNSSHHQAVKVLAPGFEIIQHADDGTVEAIYSESLRTFAVQWHPEIMQNGLPIFEYFIGLEP